MIIRICTEYKNYERVLELTDKFFTGYTVYHAKGCWKGIQEPTMIIEIALLADNALDLAIAKKNSRSTAEQLAREIKELNAQEAVLIEYIDSTNILI